MRTYLCTLFLSLSSVTAAVAQCDTENGGIVELQMTTNLPAGLLRSNGTGCILGAIANGGLEMVGANVSVIDGDTTWQVLTWTGSTWIPRGVIRDTVLNGLYRNGRQIKMGGTLVEHTAISGQQTYDFTLDNARNIYFEAQRTGGSAYATLSIGSSSAQGVDFFHVNQANPNNQAFNQINHSTGNDMSIKNGSYIAGMRQYDNGGSDYRVELFASNGALAKNLVVDNNSVYLKYPDRIDATNEAGIMMVDTITGEIRYQSPDILLSAFGDDWGGQSASVTARLSGNGTAGSPLDMAQQGATTGNVLRWNGSAWAPSAPNMYDVVTTSQTVPATVNQIFINTLASAITLNLAPCNAANNGVRFEFVKSGGDNFAATIEPAGSEQFNDSATQKKMYSPGTILTCTCRWNGTSGSWFYANM